MSTAPTEAEVERAKAQVKASLLLGLDGTTQVAEDIGRQIVTAGKRLTPAETEALVDAVSTSDVQRVAQKYLWDRDVRRVPRGSRLTPAQIAIAALGRTEGCVTRPGRSSLTDAVCSSTLVRSLRVLRFANDDRHSQRHVQLAVRSRRR